MNIYMVRLSDLAIFVLMPITLHYNTHRHVVVKIK